MTYQGKHDSLRHIIDMFISSLTRCLICFSTVEIQNTLHRQDQGSTPKAEGPHGILPSSHQEGTSSEA